MRQKSENTKTLCLAQVPQIISGSTAQAVLHAKQLFDPLSVELVELSLLEAEVATLLLEVVLTGLSGHFLGFVLCFVPVLFPFEFCFFLGVGAFVRFLSCCMVLRFCRCGFDLSCPFPLRMFRTRWAIAHVFFFLFFFFFFFFSESARQTSLLLVSARKSVPSHHLTWNLTGGSWKTIFLLKEPPVRFHVNW